MFLGKCAPGIISKMVEAISAYTTSLVVLYLIFLRPDFSFYLITVSRVFHKLLEGKNEYAIFRIK